MIHNRKDAGAVEKANQAGIPIQYFPKSIFEQNPEQIVAFLRAKEIDFILLAGFLLLLPSALLEAYPDRILNIHPALLPKYGGQGMYGHHVHEAVKAAGETESGMTIHLASPRYDEGKIIFKAGCKLVHSDSPSDIAARVLQLEHIHYGPVAECYILQFKSRS